MRKSTVTSLAVAVMLVCAGQTASAQTRSLEAALSRGKVTGQFNLRYEGVEEDNALEKADALTLRSAIKYTTAAFKGFTGVAEFEDVSVVGVDRFAVPVTGFNTGRYSVIADPETTELNQGYLQYNSGGFLARVGRQDIRYDNQRIVGAVPWRQDYQSFDAVTLEYKKDAASAWTVDYHYITQRERIFAEAGDINSKDHILHGVIATPIGSLVGYAVLLEDDIAVHNALDTYGVRLTGTKRIFSKYDATYLAEFATQDYERALVDRSADFYHLEGGITVSGITGKVGVESLGSDGGAYGFSTPLATLHAFQGWADQFLATPNQGIEDWYLSLGKTVAGGALTFVYHDYSADHSSPAVDDLGEEYNIQWIKPIRNNYQIGIKYADYQQGDLAAKADKQILWTWLQLNF
jgi:hypothetical protein